MNTLLNVSMGLRITLTNNTNVNNSRDPNTIKDVQATGAELRDLRVSWARAGDERPSHLTTLSPAFSVYEGHGPDLRHSTLTPFCLALLYFHGNPSHGCRYI